MAQQEAMQNALVSSGIVGICLTSSLHTGCKRFHFCVIFTFHVYSRNVICFMVFFGEPHCGSVKPSGDYWMVRHGSNGTGESQRAAHLSRHSLVEGRSFADHCAGTLHFSQRSCNIHEGRLPRADWVRTGS